MKVLLGTLAFAAGIAAPGMASATTPPAPQPGSATVALVGNLKDTTSKKPAAGPDVTVLLTPGQIDDAWSDYLKDTFDIEHSA